ncbi:sporulation protein YtfJ [Rossellomorea vietnamensis]|uniref:Sporulation protein YtfJ n=1 Tax=Rossellomorea vietnamensis TaxID=218284 RepID=A0A5D4K582_9BACI|nr:GerW family sporulation protein [Rossellomorea vietnamensis]TYR72591.1 sporulation protein YtfJ [Rossellomorea vietnamensis]
MGDHPIEGLMNSAMENLKQMVDVNTIIGDPVETPDGSVILTVSKVGFGFAAGGSDFNFQSEKSESEEGRGLYSTPFGGGSGGGVSIVPIAFLVVKSNNVKLIHLNEGTHLLERIIDLMPQGVERIQSALSKTKINNDEDSKNQ